MSKLDQIAEIVSHYPEQHAKFVELAQDGGWYEVYAFAITLLNQQKEIYETINRK